MTVTIVRPIGTLEAIHSEDADVRETLISWSSGHQLDEVQIIQLVDSNLKHVREIPIKPWFVRDIESGAVQAVAPATFISSFEDVAATDVLNEVYQERMTHAEHGYTIEHDEAHGLHHLINVAKDHLSGFGEMPTDQFIRGEIITAMSVLNAAVDLMDRLEERTNTSD